MNFLSSLTRGRGARRAGALLGAAVLLASFAVQAAPADATASHVLIEGSGSSWAQNAVNQWISDVYNRGIQVVFSGSGSAQGRKDFSFYTNDFAVSDIGYQGVDALTGESDTSNGRAYAYLPIAAGGTAFPYQVKVGGKLVRNLRLSGLTLAKIFTNKITNWNDPAITADNNGRVLPSIPIIPVVHSEGSGSTAQFTTFLNDQYPSIWQPFFGVKGLTEYYPRHGQAIAQTGSDGVMNFVASSAANGAIGFDEYSYALAKNFPVAKIKNSAGYFTLPTQYNDAVALTKAQINSDPKSKDYLLQNLHGVYVNPDKRTYPLSSYSYMVVPTGSSDKRLTTAKRQTLADFLFYSICTGQKEIGPIGYSPLPINLVSAGFAQIAKLKQADPGVDLTKVAVTSCNNPTFVAGQPKRNYLAEIAPMPPACDRAGAGPCADGVTSSNQNPGSNGGKNNGGKSGPSGATGTGGPTGSGGATGPGGVNSGVGPSGAASVDPATGVVSTNNDGSTTTDLLAVPADISASASSTTNAIGGVLVLEILALLIGPPLLVVYFRRRRGAA
jgi:ABC-type phosphate transport system substrate-binding protein